MAYLPFLMRDRFGATGFVIGMSLSALSLSDGLVVSLTGRLSGPLSGRELVELAFGLYAVSLVAVPLSFRLWVLVIFLAFGIGQGLNNPSIQVMLMELAPPSHRASFMSVNGMVLRLGQSVGPIIGALAYGVSGLSGVSKWAPSSPLSR